MITTEAASLTLSIAQGIIKMAGRLDRLMAEKEAQTGEWILPMPAVRAGPGGVKMVGDLRELLAKTSQQSPDPVAPHRDEISRLLAGEIPDPAIVLSWYKKFFPERSQYQLINPDDQFFSELKRKCPTLDLEDESVRYAAFSIASGRDGREIGYPWRAALIMIDVCTEFGAQNTAMFINDEKVRPILQSVLARFAEPDLDSFTMWSPLLRHALRSTLNGVLDSREAWQGENGWINSVLNALVSARQEGGDDYLLGLMQGTGYRLLISEGLAGAAAAISDEYAGPYEKIVSDILKEAAPLWKKDEMDFGLFFQDHWGDLFRAGLRSLEKQGPSILEGTSPLLRKTLMAVVKELSQTANAQFLSNDTVFSLTDAALSAAASSPDILTGDIEEPWLRTLITSVAGTVSDQGIRKSLSREGLEGIINRTLGDFAAHPELIIVKPGFMKELVRNVLEEVSGLDSLKTGLIATAAIEGALDAVEENPSLLETRYAELIAGFAGKMADLVSKKTITGIQAADIAAAASEAVLLNPVLFLELENRLSEVVVDSVLKAAEQDKLNLLYGTVLVSVIDDLLGVMARCGRTLLKEGSPEELMDRLTGALTAGMVRADVELGRNLDMPALPIVLSGIAEAALSGELQTLNPDDHDFIILFADLADHAAAYAERS